MPARKKCVISKASPHTIKKFELITDKTVYIYLNDKDAKRVDELEKHLPQNERNFQIVTSRLDAHELLKTIGPQLYQTGHLHYFLLYDPYDASIDWEALLPFFLNWGEVMINHMVSDPVRAITSANRKTTKEKYENTYLEDFEKLVPYGSDKSAYEARVEEIIASLHGTRRYYVAAFPFYNTNNSHMYNLIHYPTPNMIEQDLHELLEAVAFTDRIIFGRTNYSKTANAYEGHRHFYNDCAAEVTAFCQEHGIAYHIKEKTITEE